MCWAGRDRFDVRPTSLCEEKCLLTNIMASGGVSRNIVDRREDVCSQNEQTDIFFRQKKM
jgi:hypothetical protein